MKIKLLDYDSQSFEYDIGDLSHIACIDLEVVSGDEIATVLYQDGRTTVFDTSPNRIIDFNDGGYTIYKPSENINLLDDKKWINRETSYDYP